MTTKLILNYVKIKPTWIRTVFYFTHMYNMLEMEGGLEVYVAQLQNPSLIDLWSWSQIERSVYRKQILYSWAVCPDLNVHSFQLFACF